MSTSDSIRLFLNIKDPNVIFDDSFVRIVSVNRINTLVFSARLSPDIPDVCPKCGCLHTPGSIIRYGSKTSTIRLPAVSNMSTVLKLKKQRFLCHHCHSTFTAKTSLVPDNCFISDNTRKAIILQAKKKFSQNDIAEMNDVSHGTVNALLQSVYKDFVFKKNYLPPHLSFDEFRSTKDVRDHLSFLVIDGEKGDVIDILPDRRQNALITYFKSYSKAARAAVKTVSMDMHAAYMNVVKACFPNARIIIDRFHIVQLLNRSLNQTRIHVMKQFSRNDIRYKRLKKYWRLLLKDERDIKDDHFNRYYYYPHMMRQIDILHDLLAISEELTASYERCQLLIRHLHNRDTDQFMEVLNRSDMQLSKPMKTAIKTLRNYSAYVRNALQYEYSNGRIEGTNNLIKVIKRIAFGYRSFVSFKVRILLICNTLVRLNY